MKLKKTQEVVNTACRITQKDPGVLGKGLGGVEDTGSALSQRHGLCGSEAMSNVKGTASPLQCCCQTCLIVTELSLWFLFSSRCRKIRGQRNQLSRTVRNPSDRARLWTHKGRDSSRFKSSVFGRKRGGERLF